MRRTTVGASVGVLALLATLLASCGTTEDPGYLASGPANDRAPDKLVAPTDDVMLTPLDGPSPGADGSTSTPADAAESADSAESADKPGGRPGDTAAGSVPPADTAEPPTPTRPPSSTTPDTPADNAPAPSSPSPTPTPADNTPAHLKLSTPLLTNTDVRWCERVTVKLHNTGGRPVTDGTITFATHIIGGLGIDWGTRKSTRELPVPIAGGETEKHTWKVCLDAWRVPLGMHITTKDATATWK
ncbi:hypothetical protein [Streptomyces sp. NPDC053542]|uniref:hypothetical protein n=1 Tax=Streptomyces sp. NPDC053542 TaxID=3365710 RepID=UPI0037D01747